MVSLLPRGGQQERCPDRPSERSWIRHWNKSSALQTSLQLCWTSLWGQSKDTDTAKLIMELDKLNLVEMTKRVSVKHERKPDNLSKTFASLQKVPRSMTGVSNTWPAWLVCMAGFFIFNTENFKSSLWYLKLWPADTCFHPSAAH